MSMTVVSYNTTTWQSNSTQSTYTRNPNEILELNLRFIPLTVVSIPANLGIIILILYHKTLRTQTFFLGVLSLSVFDLCFSVFALPMLLDSLITWGEWRHGYLACLIYIVILNSKIFMTAFMVGALCIERVIVKLRLVALIGEKTATTLSRVTIVIPWCLWLLGAVLIVLAKQGDMTKNRYIHETYCVFLVDHTFHIPFILIAYHIPLYLLVLITITTMVIYKFWKSDWNRLSAEIVEPEVASLFMSTLCVWITSFVFAIFNTPWLIWITRIVICIRRMTECPSIDSYFNNYFVSLIPTAVLPFIWLITVDIRVVLSSVKNRVMTKITSSGGQKNALSFSSLSHKMSSSEDSAVQH
ncbi:uncharacterized protein LOC132546135 isoform X2 [Ylistrum balloti]|uniref:uncharacterized protein LOC132546135 isoform X2 n=1 Tax=Ylistrum balloti TaxID=509963 RepID=UPI002905A66E|nr:uncharacterized protein LOC132546135 isoform X2 [Ylistrum balloti]